MAHVIRLIGWYARHESILVQQAILFQLNANLFFFMMLRVLVCYAYL